MPEKQSETRHPLRKRTDKLTFLYLDATANVVGVLGPIAAVISSIRPYRELIANFPQDPERSIPYLALFTFNIACGGAFIVAGENARKRANQLMGISKPKRDST